MSSAKCILLWQAVSSMVLVSLSYYWMPNWPQWSAFKTFSREWRTLFWRIFIMENGKEREIWMALSLNADKCFPAARWVRGPQIGYVNGTFHLLPTPPKSSLPVPSYLFEQVLVLFLKETHTLGPTNFPSIFGALSSMALPWTAPHSCFAESSYYRFSPVLLPSVSTGRFFFFNLCIWHWLPALWLSTECLLVHTQQLFI